MSAGRGLLRGVRDDLGAGLRHFLVRLRSLACDPLALFLLLLAGVATVLFWSFGLGVDTLTAALQPFGIGCGGWSRHFTFTSDGVRDFFLGCTMGHSGPLVPAYRLASGFLMWPFVVAQIFWSVLVAAVVAGRAADSSRGSRGTPLPALPMGPRTRILAEVLAGLVLVVLARLAVMIPARESFLEPTSSGALWKYSGLTYPVVLAQTTALGTLLVLPMVVAWRTVTRRDARALVRPAVALLLLFASAAVGAMAHLWSAVPLSLALSAFLLVQVDVGDRRGAAARPRPLVARASPGPLRQLRRDAWLGPLRTLGLFAGIVLLAPLALEVLYPRRFPLLPLLQVLALAVLPFFPFGLELPSTGGALFGGSFVRAWSALPVPRARVVRALYLHGLVAAGVVWLVLCAQVLHYGGLQKLRVLPLFELPAVFLAAGILVCEGVGDRRRGLLGLACLVGFQLVVPLLLVAADFVPSFGALRPAGATNGRLLIAAGYGLGLLGSLPPLVHLRRGAAPV